MHRCRSLGVALVMLLELTADTAVLAQDATPEVVEPILTGDMAFREYADFGIVDASTMPPPRSRSPSFASSSRRERVLSIRQAIPRSDSI